MSHVVESDHVTELSWSVVSIKSLLWRSLLMKLKTWLATGVLATITSSAFAATEIAWWHSMTGALGERVNALADEFNKGQSDYKVVPVYKGTYDESMAAAIAAYRAGNAPDILQV